MTVHELIGSGTRPRVAVLQHAAWEKPGLFAALLAERGMDLVTARLDQGEQPPDGVDAVLAMGGPMSVNDDLPWLSGEMDYIKQAVESGKPYFGVCLGAQLLAASFGGRVEPSTGHHGMLSVQFVEGAFRDPIFGGLPRAIPVFQWHGENLECPPGATRLAASAECPNEAIRIGPSAYGVQFHLEVDPPLLTEWLEVPACAAELVERKGPESPAAVSTQLATQAVRLERFARRIFRGWLDLIVARSGG